ncbi:uncharacterized protein EDB91DRAFT_1249096 [Suillus paluster]|uniref:uncharacterized protein n=1 Tax=Suillus paluster TaxID=48578 RepID=UPI001B85F096|nr:uncharacterized protein EDB91DRAFT_1249096 [Suillus paluster]KAG1738918.1 hypothetical protein EDB91DRAFT_1249096 [Suillus paluster]
MVDWNDPDLEEKSGMLSERLLYIIVGLYGIASEAAFIPMAFAPIHHRSIQLLDRDRFACDHDKYDDQNVDYLEHQLLAALLASSPLTRSLYSVATVRASTRNGVCMTSFVNPAYAGAVPVYSMFHDCALLVFTIVGLWRIPSSSTLWKTLVTQGVIYFVINLAANIVALVLNRLNLNPIMNNIFSIPTICICTIASSQVVLSLLRASPDDDSDSASSVKSPPLMTDFTVPQFPSVAEPEEGIRLESPQVLHGPQLSNGTRYPVLANETF